MGFVFPYFDQSFSSCYISNNGFISFGYSISYAYYTYPPSGQNIIAPFVYDLYSAAGGDITYKSYSSNESEILNIIGTEINQLLITNFMPNNSFVITFDAVYACYVAGTVSLQLILSTDSEKSYLTVNYGHMDFICDITPFIQYFINNVLGQNTFSCSESFSNVNVNGKWIFPLFGYLLLIKK